MATMIRRPTGDGDIYPTGGDWVPSSGSTYWPLVDEETANDLDNYSAQVPSGGGYLYHTFSPFTILSGNVINRLRIYFRSYNGSGETHRAAIKVNGTRYPIGTQITSADSAPVDRYYDFTTNPATGSAWTLADINGTGATPLQQFGIGGVYSTGYFPVQVFQIYAVVDYTIDVSGPAHLKTFNGTQASNIKTRNGVNQINVKTIHGV